MEVICLAAFLFMANQSLSIQQDWLMNLVLVPGHILPPVPSNSIPGTEQSERYNPFRQFALIGECDFDQDKIASFPFDWSALLQSCLGASADIVKRLAFNIQAKCREGLFWRTARESLKMRLRHILGLLWMVGMMNIMVEEGPPV